MQYLLYCMEDLKELFALKKINCFSTLKASKTLTTFVIFLGHLFIIRLYLYNISTFTNFYLIVIMSTRVKSEIKRLFN